MCVFVCISHTCRNLNFAKNVTTLLHWADDMKCLINSVKNSSSKKKKKKKIPTDLPYFCSARYANITIFFFWPKYKYKKSQTWQMGNISLLCQHQSLISQNKPVWLVLVLSRARHTYVRWFHIWTCHVKGNDLLNTAENSIESIHFTDAWSQTKEVIPVVFPIQSI